MSALGCAVVSALGAGCAAAALPAGIEGAQDGKGLLTWVAEEVEGSAVASALREAGRRGRREREAAEELPQMMDIVTLGLYAGLSFDAALELYCEKHESALSESMREAMLSWRIGAATRGEALDRAAKELSSPALSRFAAAVAEALSFGSPLASSLELQARLIRDEQRSRVEEEIERVPVKMLVPMGTLIVPAMLLAILGPILGSALVIG